MLIGSSTEKKEPENAVDVEDDSDDIPETM